MSVSVQLTNARHTKLVWVKGGRVTGFISFPFASSLWTADLGQDLDCHFSLFPFFFSLSVQSLWFPLSCIVVFFVCVCVLVRLKTSKVLYVLLQGRPYKPKIQDSSLYSPYIMLRHQKSTTRWKAAVAEPETKPRCCAFHASSSLTPFPPRACFVCIHFQFSVKKDKKAGIHLP